MKGEKGKPTLREVLELGDVVAVLTKKGMAGAVFLNGSPDSVPFHVKVHYTDEGSAGPIRQVTIKAGWTAREWKAVSEAQEPSEPAECGRLLVGQGSDTSDPLCALSEGHEGVCRPAEARPSPSSETADKPRGEAQ